MPRTKETKGRRLSRVMLTVLSAAIIAASIFIPAARAENPQMTVVYALDSANLTFRDSDAANINQINYAFALIRDGEAVGSHWAAIDRVRAYLRKHPHIRGVMAVGGWGAEGFSDACATADGRARLADSILRLMDAEFLLVDDASPDGAGAVLAEYARRDSRFRVLTHSQNRGLFAARMTGADAATGKYLAFLDSDDFVSVDFYRAEGYELNRGHSVFLCAKIGK